jgi:hypothetical protein
MVVSRRVIHPRSNVPLLEQGRERNESMMKRSQEIIGKTAFMELKGSVDY